MQIRTYIFLLVVALCSACNVSDTEAKIDDKPFFDLAGFIDAQVTELNAQQLNVEKTVVINGQEETQRDPELDFERDLAIFRRSDINRVAWADKYEVKETTDQTSYIATDSSLQTQLLRVFKKADGAIERIYIERRMGNFLSDGRQQLTYLPGKGYKVVSRQQSGIVGDVDVDLRVSFN